MPSGIIDHKGSHIVKSGPGIEFLGADLPQLQKTNKIYITEDDIISSGLTVTGFFKIIDLELAGMVTDIQAKVLSNVQDKNRFDEEFKDYTPNGQFVDYFIIDPRPNNYFTCLRLRVEIQPDEATWWGKHSRMIKYWYQKSTFCYMK